MLETVGENPRPSETDYKLLVSLQISFTEMGLQYTKATWACWALLLTVTGLALTSDITDTEYSELLQAVKQGTFSLDGRGQDDSKQVLQGILDKSESFHSVLLFRSPVFIGITHPGLVGIF